MKKSDIRSLGHMLLSATPLRFFFLYTGGWPPVILDTQFASLVNEKKKLGGFMLIWRERQVVLRVLSLRYTFCIHLLPHFFSWNSSGAASLM